MSMFDGEALFESGPTRFEVGGRGLKYAMQHPLHGRGVRVLGQGQEGRRIRQVGTLTADTAEALQAQVEAIEAKLDGLAHVLVDDGGRAWANVVMLSFESEGAMRLGGRWKREYRIEYVQAAG